MKAPFPTNICVGRCNALRLRWAKLAQKSSVIFWIRDKGGNSPYTGHFSPQEISAARKSSCFSTMRNGDNRCHIFGTIVSRLLCALSSFARRNYFTAFIDVISRKSEDVPVVIAGIPIHLIKTKATAKIRFSEDGMDFFCTYTINCNQTQGLI